MKFYKCTARDEMGVVVRRDSLKGSFLSSLEAGQAIKEGVQVVRP